MIEYQFHTDDHIHYYTGKVFKHMATITKKEFAWWLKLSGKLDYVVDSADHTGEHQQSTWSIDFEEYLNTALASDISNDIAEFLKDRK